MSYSFDSKRFPRRHSLAILRIEDISSFFHFELTCLFWFRAGSTDPAFVPHEIAEETVSGENDRFGIILA